MRGFAIALFYAIGTGAGGFAAPLLFGWLIGTGSRDAVAAGYALGAALVIVAGLLALRSGSTPNASRWRRSPRRSGRPEQDPRGTPTRPSGFPQ